MRHAVVKWAQCVGKKEHDPPRSTPVASAIDGAVLNMSELLSHIELEQKLKSSNQSGKIRIKGFY